MNFWPHIKISRNENGKIEFVFFGKRQIAISDFEFSSGNPLIIIASGPSVKDVNIDFFDSKKFDLLGVNGAYRLSPSVDFKYQVIIDRTFILNRFEIILDVLKNKRLTLITTMDCLNEILRKDCSIEIKCKIIIIDDVEQPVYERKKNLFEINNIDLTIKRNVAFSFDLNKGFYDGCTVAYVALQMAFFLNYKEIYFAGLDMNNFDKPRFYESSDDSISTELNENLDNIIIPCFDLSEELAKQNGIMIYNLSMHSTIDSFEKIEYISVK
ncbi:hypothetical protein [Xenorhabdus littoralis]|uniref:hypothetical protein n=1 Tax=Xenorhabdus littoralis TaxID=2582835 RepID=UPI0029E805D6|nr:hypothetical protein [Xenorhabdus sp. psl]MDX7992016.1 lipopolysaccharide biosynthesis protein [Xenorhabdus sp. psl]